MSKPTQKMLLSIFDYDPGNGELTRKAKLDSRGWPLSRRKAGHVRKDGYVHVQIGPASYYAHCIIWCMVSGVWPAHQIDHKNLCRSDNRLNNLRPATPSQNKANIRPLNAIKAKGIEVLPSGKFRARLRCNGRDYHLGCFTRLEDARSAYAKCASEMFGEYARV